MLNFCISDELKKIPEEPGVYLMHASSGEIIYIGKAKNLKRRVGQYFNKSKKHGPKIERMVELVAYFEYIVTESEDEAFVVENNLIKEYLPRYNTMLKDDKTYPYIRLSLKESYPRLSFTRKLRNDKAKYYGPYPDATACRETIDLLNRAYKLRTCRRSLPKDIGKGRPCLNYHIGRCDAPCKGDLSKEEYAERIQEVKRFLSGNYGGIFKKLKEEMKKASDQMEYEKAAEYKELISAAKRTFRAQKIRPAAKNTQLTVEEMREISEMEKARVKGAVSGICEALGIGFARRIESYDISNVSGMDSVASMVVYEEGSPKKSDYRKFRIKTVEGANDPASMAEVIRRRFTHKGAEGDSFSRRPDLLLIDGGKTQVNAVKAVLKELETDIPVCGMVKDNHHRTRGLLFENQEIYLDRSKEPFKLVTRIQDETHRFAIEYHRRLRSRGQVHSVLDDIEGIGPKRRLSLMKNFKTLDAIKSASEEELAAAPGMNRKAAHAVAEFFSEGNF